MIAKLTSRKPVTAARVDPISDTVPWGIVYHPGDAFPLPGHLPAGTYTLPGRRSGSASVTVTENAEKNADRAVAVTYRDYTNDGTNILNGSERVELVGTDVVRHEDLTLTANTRVRSARASQKASPSPWHSARWRTRPSMPRGR
jgi:hypothetical protein